MHPRFKGVFSASLLRVHILFYAVLLIVSAHFATAYAVGTISYVDLADYQNGLARLPFQYRVLTSWLLHGLVRVPGFADLARQLPLPFQQPEVLALTLVNLGAVTLVTEIVRRIIEIYVDDYVLSRVFCFLMPFSMYFSYVALANSYKLSFPYDIPNLPIFAACLYAIFRNKVGRLHVLFFIACLSRETSVFLVVIYLLWHMHRPVRNLASVVMHACIMLAILAVTKYVLFGIYAGNPMEHGSRISGIFTLRFQQNLEYLTQPQYWPNLFSSFGFLWIILALCYRYVPDPALRRTLWVVVPWTGTMFVVGVLTEVRIFGELTVLLSAVVSVGAFNFLKARGYQPLGVFDDDAGRQ